MRTRRSVLTLLVAIPLCATLSAQDPATRVADRFHDLNLTDAQATKIAGIQKECQPKIQAAAKELAAVVKDEGEKIRGVLTPEQTQKLQAFKDERKEHRAESLAERFAHLEELDLTDAELSQIADLRKQFRPRMDKVMEGFKGVLTDEQKKAREEAMKAGKKHQEVNESLQLTGEQKQKLETAGKEVCTLFREELDQIRGVLMAEQQAKLADVKDERPDRIRDRWAARIANLRDLNLTDAQKAAIAEIRKDFRPRVHEAGNKLRGAVKEEVGMILDVIKG